MSGYHLRSNDDAYNLRSKVVKPNETKEERGINYYRDIKAMRIPWTETCPRDGLSTLKSNLIQFPFIDHATSKMYINFVCKENNHLFFQREVNSLFTSQQRINAILGYFNNYSNIITLSYYNELVAVFESYKVYPASEFALGDYCAYPNAAYENKLVRITGFDNKQKMFPVQAKSHPVNVVVHIHQDINKLKLVNDSNDNYVIFNGVVPNKHLHLIMGAREVSGMTKKEAKLTCSALLYKFLYESKSEKYENEQRLNKDIFKEKMKYFANEVQRLLGVKSAGHKRVISIDGVNAREFRRIYKKNFKQMYELVHWKDYQKSVTLNISSSSATTIFGANKISKDLGLHVYALDETQLKYEKDSKKISLIAHYTEKNKESGMIKGDAKSKRDRKNAKAKRKRRERANNNEANV